MSSLLLASTPPAPAVDPVFVIFGNVCLVLATGLAVASLVALLFFRRATLAGLGCAVGAILVGQFPLLLSAHLYRTSSALSGIEGTNSASAGKVVLPLAVVIVAALLASAWQWIRSRETAMK